MPWLDDMQALSTAMTQQGPRGQAQMAQAAPPLPPRPVSEDVQARLSHELAAGRISVDQYKRGVGLDRPPPPGVDPHDWELMLKPVMVPPPLQRR